MDSYFSKPDSDFKYEHSWSEDGLECSRCLISKADLRTRPVHRHKCDAIPINLSQQPIIKKIDEFFDLLKNVQPHNSQFVDNLIPSYGLFERDLSPFIDYINSEIGVKTNIMLKSNHSFGLLSLYSGFSKTMLLCALMNKYNSKPSETLLIYVTFNQSTAILEDD